MLQTVNKSALALRGGTGEVRRVGSDLMTQLVLRVRGENSIMDKLTRSGLRGEGRAPADIPDKAEISGPPKVGVKFCTSSSAMWDIAQPHTTQTLTDARVTHTHTFTHIHTALPCGTSRITPYTLTLFSAW